MSDFFASTRPGTTVTHGGATFELPILYFRDDVFALFYTADARRARELMPSDRLHPVLVSPGRTLVGIVAFNYVETSIGPYGEVGVVVPTVHGRRPLPLLPGALEARYPGFGYVVLHLPVTRTAARDAGRGQWGYTKFVADMHFVNTPEHLECRMLERERHILTLRVARRGLTLRDAKPLVTYSVLDGDLVRTVIPQRGEAKNAVSPSGCALQLGAHPLTDTLLSLDLSDRPLMSRHYLQRSGILPAGEVVERGVRALDGYAGEDREGEHTVDYLGR